LLYAWRGYQAPWVAEGAPSPLLFEGLILALLLPVCLVAIQRVLQGAIRGSLEEAGNWPRWQRVELLGFALFVLAGALPAPLMARTLALAAGTVLLHAVGAAVLLRKRGRDKVASSQAWIPALFLVSGFAALIYQVVWQRVLFTTFGVNSESVTVVVSVFMFGLGMGALAGGWLQRRFPAQRLRLFLVLEGLIGAFGLASLELIGMVGAASGETSTVSLVLRVYSILAIPTLLMGATLPVLVAFLQDYYRNIGKTVAQLYALNTLGSALAAFATVSMIFVLAGLKTAVLIAAACNLVTAWLIADASRRRALLPAAPVEPERDEPVAGGDTIPFAAALALLALVGFVSLSQEIVWFRLLGFMSGTRPDVFGFMLAAFLLGIAGGSLRAKSACGPGASPAALMARWMLTATAIFYLAAPLLAQVADAIGAAVALTFAYLAVAAVAYFSGGMLPLLVQMAVRQRERDGTQLMAWLYFANIIGATAGPLITGFILLDRVSLQDSIAWISGLGLLVVAALAVLVRTARVRNLFLGGCVAAVAAGWTLHGAIFAGYLEKSQYAPLHKPFAAVVENRAGIITVAAMSGGDTMFGGGVYDGRFNTNPVTNSNQVDRAYMLAALHRDPADVLEIGLATGSWTWAISRLDTVKHITVVEINKGYPAVAAHYPAVAGIFTDPKVTVEIDDARRWLRNHPQRKFDAIVMNATFHWRSNATNLLSREFLELCREHLNPGGVVYYNTTSSQDVVFTAAHVFRHVTMVSNFVAASDAPFDQTPDEKRAHLLRFRGLDGKPFFEQDEAHRRKLAELSRMVLPELRETMLGDPRWQVVTDDNMAVEYKRR
jgi:spermidine synthase